MKDLIETTTSATSATSASALGNIVVFKLRPEDVDADVCDDMSRLTSLLCMRDVQLSVEYVLEITTSTELFCAVDASNPKRILGMACLVKMSLPQGTRLLLESVIVDPAERNRGVASRLVGSILHDARRYGAPHISLTCNPTRDSAARLYKSLGFNVANTSVLRASI